MFAIGCKQTSNSGGQKPTELKGITITVKGDEGVEIKEPNSFEVIESSSWKDIRKRAEAMLWLYDENKIIKEWRLKDEKGKVLQDGTTFKKDETVFAITKEKPLKNPITITIQADEGYRFKEATQPCTIQVEKGEKWCNIEPKARAKIELKEDYEERAWKLGGKDGSYLTDGTYIFSANATIYARSEKRWMPKIRIHVYGDYGVEIPYLNNDIEVEEGSKWADIKAKVMAIATPREYFKIKEWRLNDKDGKIIEDTYEFKEYTTVYAVSSRIIAQYKVEHLKENIEDDNYTKAEEETKTGEAGEMTNAEAKQYEGFSSQWSQLIDQSVIKADGSTVVQIKYKRDIVSLILNLDGGKTETELTKTWGGKTILKGKFEARVEVKGLEKEDYSFEKWEPLLPPTFPATSQTVYTAKWKLLHVIRLRLEGDERVEVEESKYIEVPSGKAFGKIKNKILTKFRLKSEWSPFEYTFYDWRIGGKEGEEILDSTPMNEDMVVYARTNYKEFRLSGTTLTGCGGKKPRGRIFLPKEITEIEGKAFEDCENLTAVDFSGCSEITRIGSGTFKNCTSLESIDLSPCTKLTEIESAFSGCSKLKSVDLTGCTEITEIGGSAFENCTSLESIDLSPCTKLTKIRWYAFSGCSKLKSVNLSGCGELTEIWDKVFKDCSSLESIDLSPCTKLGIIMEKAFFGCSRLKSVDLTGCAEITEIGKYAFYKCTSLESIDLSLCTKLNIIMEGAFLDCSKLKSVNLTGCSELKRIYGDNEYGDGAFENCISLEGIDLSPCTKLRQIGRKAFFGCSRLKSVDLTGCAEITEIGKYAFYKCTSLESIDLSPCTKLRQIGKKAFFGCSKAWVRLPASITHVWSYAFGDDLNTYCGKVLVPNETVKKWVKASHYPEYMIEMY